MRIITLVSICLFVSSIAFTQDRKITFINVPDKLNVDCGKLPTEKDIKVKSKCDGAVEVSFDDSRASGECGNLLRTIVAKDACGNIESFSQIIIFKDTEAPVFVTLPEDLDLADRFEYTDHPGMNFPEVRDNCAGEIRTNVVHKDEFIGDKYVIQRTYIAIDGCGNKAEHTQTIRVNAPNGQ